MKKRKRNKMDNEGDKVMMENVKGTKLMMRERKW